MDLSFNHIGNAGMVALADAFEAVTATSSSSSSSTSTRLDLKELRISAIEMDQDGVAALGRIINGTKEGMGMRVGLEVLDVSANNFGPIGCSELASALCVDGEGFSCSLQGFDISSNNIGHQGTLHVAKLLGRCPGMQKLKLTSNGIGAKGIASLGEVAASGGLVNLVVLDLSHSKMGPFAAASIAAVLGSSHNLQKFVGASNALEDAGIVVIADSLKRSKCRTTLSFLSLSSTSMGDDGLCALADAIVEIPNLYSLDLGRNKVGMAGIDCLSASLLKCPKLYFLSLKDTPSLTSADSLARVFEWSLVQRVELRGCSFRTKDKATLTAVWVAAGKDENHLIF